MDGYAVRAEDTFSAGDSSPALLELAGSVHAGENADTGVTVGRCVQIATGAIMPAGADAVVMVENTDSSDDGIQVFGRVPPGENVSRAGEDLASGSTVLKTGTALTPSSVGVIAALGLAEVDVYRRPDVAVLPTGGEVVPPGRELKPGQVHDINTFTLGSLVDENGGRAVLMDITGDDTEDLAAALDAALECDLVVLSGGSSVGERDLLVDVVGEKGELVFHGIQVKPGKPTLMAVINGKTVLGMPGYPTSCLLNGYVLLAPLVRKMARMPPLVPSKVRGKLSRRVLSSLGRHQFLTVRMEGDTVHPAFKESGAITSMADAHGYIEIPENVDLLDRDEEVEVVLFRSTV
jgi:molybdenum cofactor synthesis domain-containing protein